MAQPLKAAADMVAEEFEPVLGANGVAFLRRIYANGLQSYQRRLSAVGLDAGGHLLDAGCGFGQWSLAVASGYEHLTGVDVSEARVAACSRLAQLSGTTNCSFHHGELEHLPFASASFDAIVSYSVLYFTDFERAFQELGRVLRPGGKIYLSTNDVGRFLIDVVENRNQAADFHPRRYGMATTARTMLERLTGKRMAGAVAMSRARTISLLQRASFEVLEVGKEGSLGAGDIPMQAGSYAGFTAVFDVLARRI